MESVLFSQLNLSDETMRAIADMGFEEATPVQAEAIPKIMEGIDVIGQAQTGTGKTCAFGIPLSEMLDPGSDSVQALVLCPTRELAIQTCGEIKELLKYRHNLSCLPVYGGQPINRQILALKKRPQIIVGTPGRIMDHLRRKTIKTEELSFVVLDEADEMLNMGFREDIDVILEKAPKDRQTVLFSATMPQGIIDITNKYQKKPVHVNIVHREMTVSGIDQFYLELRSSAKTEVLSRLLDTSDVKLSLVFCNTKKNVDELTAALQSRGYEADSLHGDMKQETRDRVMRKFRQGRLDVLIATDVAARGIDVDDVEAVFNYDIPNDEEYYIHRIGRTGRAGRTGKAYTFVVGREIYKLKDIQRFTKAKIALMKPPSLKVIEENKINEILSKLREDYVGKDNRRYITFAENMLEELNTTNDSDDCITTLDMAAMLLKHIAMQNNENISLGDITKEKYRDKKFSEGNGKRSGSGCGNGTRNGNKSGGWTGDRNKYRNSKRQNHDSSRDFEYGGRKKMGNTFNEMKKGKTMGNKKSGKKRTVKKD